MLEAILESKIHAPIYSTKEKREKVFQKVRPRDINFFNIV